MRPRPPIATSPRARQTAAATIGLLGALLAGCTPQVVVAGGVRVAEPCATSLDRDAQTPVIEGATVTLRCPPATAAVLQAVTDARGRVLVEAKDPIGLDCEVRVERAGYVGRTYAVRDVCASESVPATPFWRPTPPPTCYGVSVPARLFPSPIEAPR